MTPQEMLWQAADIIEEHGHWKGGYGYLRGQYLGGTQVGGVCIMGAINVLETGRPAESLNGSAGVRALQVVRNAIAGSVPRWNDSHTKEEVIALLRELGTPPEVVNTEERELCQV